MAFFYEEPKATPINKSKGAAATRQKLLLGEVGCDHCPLQAMWPRISTAKMTAAGNTRDGDILVVGDSPDADDDREGLPFAGANGKLLKKAIPSRFFDRIVYQHLARCSPGQGADGMHRSATQHDIHACSGHLAQDVARLPIKAVLGVGPEALARFFPGASLRDVHGTWMPIRIGQSVLWFYPVFDPAFLRATGGRRGPEEGTSWPVFAADIRNFFFTVDKQGKPVIVDDLLSANVILVDREDDAREIIEAMEGPRAVDVETNKLRPYDTGARLLCGSVSDGNLCVSWACDHPERKNAWGIPLLVEVITRREWIAHNIVMEYSWLKMFAEWLGIPFEPHTAHDTMAIARLHHNRAKILSLEDLSQIHLGVNTKWIMNIDTKRMLDYPLQDIMQYCGLDTLSCAKMFHKTFKRVNQDRYRRLIEGSIAVADMAIMGLDSEIEVAKELDAKWRARAQDAAERVRTLYEVKEFEKNRGPFSISAPADVGIALAEYGRVPLPKTPGGKQYKTDDETLTALAVDNPLAIAVLDYRGAEKMVSPYISGILDAQTRCYDGRPHPGYTVMHTATFRLSSEDPNIQNWPNRQAEQRELRRMVVAPPRHVIVKFDQKALEARTAGMCSGDRELRRSIIAKEDIHSKWRDRSLEIYPDYIDRLAQKTGQTDMKKILKYGRDIIKTDFVFASMFGSSPDSSSNRTGIPLGQTQELVTWFWQEHPEHKQWIKQRRQEYRDTGSSRLLSGEIRHGIMTGNEPINTPIQGTGAILVIESMNALAQMSRKLKDPYLHPRIQIHDDLTFILPDDEKTQQQYIDVIVPELVRVRFEWQTIPLAVEGCIGTTWYELEEFGNFVGDYVR